jgi:hypothetical protein
MSHPTVLETNESGALQIPARFLSAGPHARFRLEREGTVVRLIPEPQRLLWESASPGERVRAWRNWVASLPKRSAPALPAEALRRENFYD